MVVMDPEKALEEKLREAACFGDEEAVKALIIKGVNVNSTNDINGWSPLHWAAKRGNRPIVEYLLLSGADETLVSAKGETPLDVAEKEDIRDLLGASSTDNLESDNPATTLPITPHYLRHPVLGYRVDMDAECKENGLDRNEHPVKEAKYNSLNYEDLVVKARIANLDDLDFIEVEIPSKALTFSNVMEICCEELKVDPRQVTRVRKLPNTILRNDGDVKRLKEFQELEFVLLCHPQRRKPVPRECSEENGTVLRSTASLKYTFSDRSAYCRNGTILY